MFSKLLNWLRNKIIPTTDEIQLNQEKKLEIGHKKAEIKDIDNKPDETPLLSAKETAQRNILKNVNNYEAARRASKHTGFKNQVHLNPGLVGADSQFEADLKLKIASGQDITNEIESNPHISTSEVKDMLGKNWAARWGYNVHGDSLEAKINEGEVETGEVETGEADTGQTETDTSIPAADTETPDTTPVETSDTDIQTSTATQASINTDTGTVTVTGNTGDSGTSSTGSSANSSGGPNT